MIAQAVDSNTMVGLARTFHADRRFFLPQPKLPQSDVSFLNIRSRYSLGQRCGSTETVTDVSIGNSSF